MVYNCGHGLLSLLVPGLRFECRAVRRSGTHDLGDHARPTTDNGGPLHCGVAMGILTQRDAVYTW